MGFLSWLAVSVPGTAGVSPAAVPVVLLQGFTHSYRSCIRLAGETPAVPGTETETEPETKLAARGFALCKAPGGEHRDVVLGVTTFREVRHDFAHGGGELEPVTGEPT